VVTASTIQDNPDNTLKSLGGFLITMFFAIIIVYLALAAQFESFKDPVVILVSVPLALFGAMIFIFLGMASVNISTEVGLVTLMGLISPARYFDRGSCQTNATNWAHQARSH
jgi:multidrug efflux pump subunit AcrB